MDTLNKALWASLNALAIDASETCGMSAMDEHKLDSAN